MRRWATWMLLSSLPLTVACSTGGGIEGPPPRETEPVEVETVPASIEERVASIEVVGTVRARRSVVISSKILSHIRRIHVSEGDRVESGRPLIELDDRELVSSLEAARAGKVEAEVAVRVARHNLESAKARLQLAERTFERYSRLIEKDSVTRQEFDQAAATLRSSRAEVAASASRIEQAVSRVSQLDVAIASAKIKLKHARIDSTVDGVVTRRLADPGSLAVPGVPLLRLEQSEGYRLELTVPESRLEALRVGRVLFAEIGALDEGGPRERRIVEIVPEIDAASRTFIVKLALENHPALRSGLHGRARLEGEARRVLTVPAAAVKENGQVRSVLVVEGDVARVRLITLGALRDGRYEVLSGLGAGEQVVADSKDLRDGDRVRRASTDGRGSRGADSGGAS